MKIKAVKLADADVQWLSLVDRGASRIPFRVIKADKETSMINLSSLIRKQAGSAPVLAAIIVAKTDLLPQMTDAIKAAGFVVDKTVEENGNVVFKQVDEELDAKTHGIAQLSPDLGIVLKGFDPVKMVAGTSLEEAVKTAGFLPSIAQVTDAHAASVQAELLAGGDVAAKVDKNSKEFNKFVVDTSKVIPTNAFKLEQEITKLVKAKAEEETPEEKKKRLEEEDKKQKEEEAKKQEELKRAAETKEALDAAAKTSEALGTVVKAMEALSNTVKSVGEQVTSLAADTKVISADTKTLAEQQKALTTRVTEAETVAKAAKDAVKGIVISGRPAGGDDGDAGHQNNGGPKKLPNGLDPITDTAFMKRERVGRVIKFSA